MKKMDTKRRRQSMILYIIIALGIAFIVRSIIMPKISQQTVTKTSYSDFLEKLDAGQVTKVQLDTGTKYIRFTTGDKGAETVYETGQFPQDATLVSKLTQHNVEFSALIPDPNQDAWLWLLINLLPFIIIIFAGWMINKRLKKQLGDDSPSMNFGGGFGGFGGIGSFGKSHAKEVKGQETGVTFNDVAGQDEAKDSLHEIVSLSLIHI